MNTDILSWGKKRGDWIPLLSTRFTAGPTSGVEILGYIRSDAHDNWSAWIEANPKPVRLRGRDDKLSAARTLCAHLRVGCPDFPVPS